MIRAAIIGLGAWGQNLVRHVQGQSDVIRFTAAATRTPAKAESFAQSHGIRMYRDYAEVLAADDVDAVVLATPHSQHTDQIVAAARAGKHVFSEKPMGLAAAEADRAAKACAEAGVTLSIGYNWRFQPALQAIRAVRPQADRARRWSFPPEDGRLCAARKQPWAKKSGARWAPPESSKGLC